MADPFTEEELASSQDDTMPYIRKVAEASPTAAMDIPTVPGEVSPTVTEAPPTVSKTPMEQLQEMALKKMQEDEADRVMLRAQLLKSRGLDEKGELKDRGLLGISGFLHDLPDYKKKILNQSANDLAHAAAVNAAAPVGLRPQLALNAPPPADSLAESMPEITHSAEALRAAGAGRLQNLASVGQLGKEVEAERINKENETPGTAKAKAAYNFIQSVSPDALPADMDPEKVSFKDIEPVLNKVVGWGSAVKRADTAKTILDYRQKMQQDKDDEKFQRWISEKTKAKMIWDPEHPGEMVDANTGLRLSGPHLERYLRLFGEGRVGPSGVIPSVGPRGAVPTATVLPGAPVKVISNESPTSTDQYSVPEDVERRNLTAVHVQKAVDKLADSLNPAKNGGVSIRNALEAQRRAANMRATLGEENIGPDNMPKGDVKNINVTELAIQLNSLLSGRAGGSAQEFKHLLPAGVEPTLANIQEYLTSSPANVDMKKWVKVYLDIAGKEAAQADKFIKDQIAPRVAGKDRQLLEKAPRERARILRSNGLDPDAFHADGTIGDYKFLQPPAVAPEHRARAKEQGKVIYYNYKTGAVQASSTPPGKPWAPVGE